MHRSLRGQNTAKSLAGAIDQYIASAKETAISLREGVKDDENTDKTFNIDRPKG